MVITPGNRSNCHQFLGVLEVLFPMATTDFFRARLDAMIDLAHPLAVLGPGARASSSSSPMNARPAHFAAVPAVMPMPRGEFRNTDYCVPWSGLVVAMRL